MKAKAKADWRESAKGIAEYSSAKAAAQQRADESGFDHMLEANHIFETFSVRMLPRRENRYGHELRGEVVSCSNLSKCQAGHGPST